MTERQLYSSGSRIEAIAGFSRAVRVGDFIFVAGTTSSDDDGNTIGPGDPARQTQFILQKIDAVLRDAGSSLTDVVRYRVFVTDGDDWKRVARQLHDAFSEVRPAGTMIEVSRIIGKDFLVEIEVDAVITDGTGSR